MIPILFLSMLAFSCSKDDNNDNTPAGDSAFQAALNGGTYSNYEFKMGVYEITKANNTLSIDIGDTNGTMVNLFLNGTDGFGAGTVKQMQNVASDNFTTNAVIRQPNQPQQITYFSSAGNVTITGNRENPEKSGHRLISGTFDITAGTIDGTNVTTLKGLFTELDYVD